jgi:hypothetical protein
LICCEQSTKPEQSSPSASGTVAEIAVELKAGTKADKGALITSEAEALRKDTLKNDVGGVDIEE